ncbi:CtrA inhibitor SciP [Dongia sp. agr-C8]
MRPNHSPAPMPQKPALTRHGERRIARIEDLPPPGIKRWVIRRKAEVVSAVRAGIISLEEACQRYTLSVEEFLSWQRSIDRHGLRGLRTTRLQDYRATEQTAADETPNS